MPYTAMMPNNGKQTGEKVAAIIPIKTNNQRLPGKNTRRLGDKPLLEHLFRTAADTAALDAVFVDSSDEGVLQVARWYGFQTIKRPESLNTPETSGHDLLNFEMPYMDYGIIAQLFVTLPFLSRESIGKAVELLRGCPERDSVLAVYEIYNRFWFQGKPVNHNNLALVGTQYMRPVYCEAGFYVFRKEAFLKQQARVTDNHAVLTIDAVEAIDIDTEADFLHAEAFLVWQKQNQQK
jgi:CMP-N-acetylneuraminic acid synthetase